MKKLLITGFEPFGGNNVNPAWEAVRLLPDTVGDYAVHPLHVPTLYGETARQVIAACEELRPDAVLCIGLAGGRGAVTPERIAVNIRDARIADNAGVLCSGERIVPDGPAAYFATVPVEAMRDAIRAVNLPAAVSNTAGTYVCNDLLYTLLHHFDGTSVCVGFLHVPYLPEQGTPGMALSDTVRALEAAITAL